ncbi:MAG: hypothetical protein P1T08_04760 [Acidimicrobiia bacterium]|nr:hypothetical protein [Acidimicrobiia bacterium]
MLAELIDLGLTALAVMWLLFVGLVVHAGWIAGPAMDERVEEAPHVSEVQLPVLSSRSA